MVSLKITENVIIKVLLAILGSYGDPMEDLTYHGDGLLLQFPVELRELHALVTSYRFSYKLR